MSSTKERKIAEKLIAEVSAPGFSLAVFADAVINQHPTHQQTLMRALVSVIEKYAEGYIVGHFDERNRGSYEAAYRMRQELDRDPVFLPYI